MTYQDLIAEFGNGNRAAKALGCSRQTVSQWKTRGIPFTQQFKIQMKTRGRLKADLSKLGLSAAVTRRVEKPGVHSPNRK